MVVLTNSGFELVVADVLNEVPLARRNDLIPLRCTRLLGRLHLLLLELFQLLLDIGQSLLPVLDISDNPPRVPLKLPVLRLLPIEPVPVRAQCCVSRVKGGNLVNDVGIVIHCTSCCRACVARCLLINSKLRGSKKSIFIHTSLTKLYHSFEQDYILPS